MAETLPHSDQSDDSPAPRRALVTGVSSGIGAAIAARLLDDGWQVVGLSRRSPPPRPGLTHYAVDLLAAEPLTPVLDQIGPVTALIHAAGLLRVGRLGELSAAEAAQQAESLWRLHVGVASQLGDYYAPQMVAGGRIVLIGSRTAQGSAGRGHYAASKAALIGLARSWAIELAGRGITVNLVSPGATDTPMLQDPARAGVVPKLPPTGRFVQPDEVAALTAFLLSPLAASITGQNLLICGGADLV